MKRGPRDGAERKFHNKGAPWRSEGGDRGDRGGFGGDRGGFGGGGRREFGGGERFGRDEGDERPARRTYRREGGPSGGFGRPSFGRDGGREGGRDFGSSPKPFAPRGPQPVPAAKLIDGVAQANKGLAKLIESFGKSIRGDYDISELEVTCCFDAEGRFVGFGAGGAVQITLNVTPLDAESILASDEGDDAQDEEEVAFSAEESSEEEASAEAEGDDEEDASDDEEITVKA